MISKKNLIRLIKFVSSYKKELFITLVSTILISSIEIIDSLLLSYLIDNVLYSNAKITLLTITFIMILISIFQIALKGYKNTLIQRISYTMNVSFMEQFYIKILHVKYSFFEKHKTGELLSRLNDTRIVQNALSEGLIAVITNVLMFIIVGTALFYINSSLFFILFISVIILGFIVIHFGNYYSKSYPIAMEKDASLQAFISESFSGIETIKTFPSTLSFINQYNKKQFDNIKINWNITEKFIIQNSVSSITDKISSVLILIFGALFVMNDKMTLGQIASFISLSRFFTSSILTLLDLQAGIQEAFAACNRLFEILDEESDSFNNGFKIDNKQAKIIFNNIDFTYSNKTELYKKFNIEINSGEWISLVGKTGCGKTTFVRLLLKMYKPQGGQILWNKTDIEKINTYELRSKIAYIPQEIVLFSGTIFENITMFDSAISKEAVIETTKKIGLYDKINMLEFGFETILGERGFSLSGGEKQKIAICRALMKKPSIIILDEATSNLDTESEQGILKILETLKKEQITIISIAHRLSTVKNCDKIYFMEKGKIVEEGNYEELIKINGNFSKWINNY